MDCTKERYYHHRYFVFSFVYVNVYILKVLYMLLKVNVDAITKTDLTKEFIVCIKSLHVNTGSPINLIPRIYQRDKMSIFCVLEQNWKKGNAMRSYTYLTFEYCYWL